MTTVSVLYFVLIITPSYGFMPTPQWLSLSRPMKGMARKWFIRRAERKGIPWTISSNSYRARSDKLQDFYDQVRDPTLEYPSYYKMPFHGYGKGNLNWKAAYEMEASAYSMSSGYWKELEYGEAAQYVRGNFTECVLRFTSSPRRILDIGCATGISTSHLAATFPNAECVTGVDLSPHFLAVARDTCERGFPNTEFVHANGESLPFDDHTFDAVCIFVCDARTSHGGGSKDTGRVQTRSLQRRWRTLCGGFGSREASNAVCFLLSSVGLCRHGAAH